MMERDNLEYIGVDENIILLRKVDLQEVGCGFMKLRVP